MPSARYTVRHAPEHLLFIISIKECGQLQDILVEQILKRRRVIELLYIQILTEYAVYAAGRVQHRHLVAAYYNQTVSLVLRILYARHHILLRYRPITHNFTADVTERAVYGNVSVN